MGIVSPYLGKSITKDKSEGDPAKKKLFGR